MRLAILIAALMGPYGAGVFDSDDVVCGVVDADFRYICAVLLDGTVKGDRSKCSPCLHDGGTPVSVTRGGQQ